MKNVSLPLIDICCSRFTHLLILAFPCTFPHCEKHFNRHDNLLQHLKVHKEPQERPTLQNLRIVSPPYLNEVQQQPAESPMDEPESPEFSTSPRSNYREVLSSSYHTYSAPYSTTESTSLLTNMAVSSLRTVLPHSPTESRTHPLQPSPRQYHSWSFADIYGDTHPKLCVHPLLSLPHFIYT